MGVPADQARPRGDVMRRLDELERQVAVLRTARRLEAASAGRGGLRLHSGGSLRVVDGGQVTVFDGGALGVTTPDGTAYAFVATTSGIFLTDGASINVLDGGTIRARYEDGSTAVLWGSLIATATGEHTGHGLLVQDNVAGGGWDIFRSVRRLDGLKAVYVGSLDVESSTAQPVDEFLSRARMTRIRNYGSSGAGIEGYEADGQVYLFSDESVITLASNVFEVRTAFQVSTEPANCFLDADGYIHRTSSRRAFKEDIRDLDVEPEAVLALRPRTWMPSRSPAGGGPTTADGSPGEGRARRQPPQRRQVGFVAEEVAEVLPELVTRGADGEPDGVAYDRVSAALLTVIRQQQQRIAALEARVAELEVAVDGM